MHFSRFVLTIVEVIESLLVVAKQRRAKVVGAVFHRDGTEQLPTLQRDCRDGQSQELVVLEHRVGFFQTKDVGGCPCVRVVVLS